MHSHIFMYGIRTPNYVNLDIPQEPIATGSDGIVNIRARYQCPYCAAKWYITGYYTKQSEGLNGKVMISMFTCYKCLKIGIPNEYVESEKDM